jgi:3-phosphoshikimate 1-carboxyvinyltransferase
VKELDAGNSGTTTRLISGVLAAQDFQSVIIGDEFLSKRPMKRIIDPLTAMGAKIKASEKYTLPLIISPCEKLIPIDYELPVASAQVKSAVLLAGLHGNGTTSVIENLPSRDHTERMLGLKVETSGNKRIVYSSKENYPEAKEYFVPSDISTAAFFIVLTLLSKNSELRLKNVSLNETRTGILTVLRGMGGNIEICNMRESAGEPLGDIIVQSSELVNVEIDKALIPNIIDEIPILSVAGAFAEGVFNIRNASELRGKETDRISAVCSNMNNIGLNVQEFNDGFSINGNINVDSGQFESFHDHRIAMAFSVLSFLLKDGGKVNNFSCVNISNPDFISQIKNIAG